MLEATLPAQARANPDLTLAEHCELLEEAQGVGVSTATMSRAFEKLGLPLKKKSLPASERDEAERAFWREGVGGLNPQRLVFVDEECGTHSSMVCLRARAPRGKRACAPVSRNRGKNTTLIASMGAKDMGPCLAVEGATTKEGVFEAYVERVLTPSLSPGQVSIIDNLGMHKGDRVGELVGERGCCGLLFLPPYSPDLSPIEEAFSKLKALLRKAATRTRGALVEAIGRALDAVTLKDTRGWFGHCGYPLDAQPS